MNVVTLIEPCIADVSVGEAVITVDLVDDRTVTVPLAWSSCLSEATSISRNPLEFTGEGAVVHWLDVDENIGVAGKLNRTPASRPAATH